MWTRSYTGGQLGGQLVDSLAILLGRSHNVNLRLVTSRWTVWTVGQCHIPYRK